jgi:hypothetical protein
MYAFAILFSVTLLPIVPAYLLFKALPNNTSTVKGKLQGLEIKLGGAFAAYFALVLLILANHAIIVPVPPAPPPPYQVWEVSGRILNEKGIPMEPIDIKDLSLAPSFLDTDRSGFFRLRFYSWPDINGGYAYPRLIISHENYEPLPVPLNPSDPMLTAKKGSLKATISGQHIDLHDISLKQLPTPYPSDLKPLNTASSVRAK